MKRFLEAGRIVNTHGVKGELSVQPWCDSAAFLLQLDTFYIDNNPVKIIEARVHKNVLLVKLEHINDINAAMRMKGKVLFLDRESISLPDGSRFIQDIIGLSVFDLSTESVLGTLYEVLALPANDVYVVRGEGHEYMIPAVSAFIDEIDIVGGIIRVRTIKGMLNDAD